MKIEDLSEFEVYGRLPRKVAPAGAEPNRDIDHPVGIRDGAQRSPLWPGGHPGFFPDG